MTPRIQRLVHERASAQDIKREALNDGMLTLREYGIRSWRGRDHLRRSGQHRRRPVY